MEALLRKGAMAGVALCTALIAPTIAYAGGMEYPDNATRALSRGGAFAAKADDPSALYFNPAGLAKVRGTQLLFNYHFVRQNYRFRRAGLYGDEYQACDAATCGDAFRGVAGTRFPQVSSAPLIPVPFFALSSDLGWRDDLTFAIGAFGPPAVGKKDYGLCVDPKSDTFVCPLDAWPSPARYDTISLDGAIVFATFGAAYRINRYVSVGAAFAWVYSKINSKNVTLALGKGDNIPERHSNDVLGELDLEDVFSPSGFLGVSVRPMRNLELALSARLPVWIEASGEATKKLNKALSAQTAGTLPLDGQPCLDEQGNETADCPLPATVKTVLPMVLRWGARWVFFDGQERERADVELDFTFENWSMLQSQKVHVEGLLARDRTPIPDLEQQFHLKDSFSVRLGGSYNFHDVFGRGQLTLSAGGFYDSAASRKEWTRLGFDGFARIGFGAGVSFRYYGFELSLGGSYMMSPARNVEDSEVRAILPEDPENEALPVVGNGYYQSDIFVLMAGLRVDFNEVFGKRKMPPAW